MVITSLVQKIAQCMIKKTREKSMNKTENLRPHYPDLPNWVPLEQIVGLSRCPQFMAMGEIIQDGITICLYKHIHTRRYLSLATDGHAYRFVNGRYEPIGLPEAIQHAFT